LPRAPFHFHWHYIDLAASTGFLAGHLKLFSRRAVEPSDAMPRQTVTAETYAEYPLIALSKDGQKEIARVTADENGNYHAALLPGDYVLEVQRRPRTHLRWKAQSFTVVSNRTVRVDMDIIAVDQWRAESMQSFRSD
jgi:hypothetical protein